MKIKAKFPTEAYLRSAKYQMNQAQLKYEVSGLEIIVKYNPKIASHVHYLSTAIGFYHGIIIEGKLINNIYGEKLEIKI